MGALASNETPLNDACENGFAYHAMAQNVPTCFELRTVGAVRKRCDVNDEKQNNEWRPQIALSHDVELTYKASGSIASPALAHSIHAPSAKRTEGQHEEGQ